MSEQNQLFKPIVFTTHALQRMKERGAGKKKEREDMKITYDKETDALYIRLLEG